MKSKSNFLKAGCFGALAALLIVLIRFVDVATIGPKSKIPKTFHPNMCRQDV